MKRLESVALVSGMVLAGMNLWTGVPFAGVWVGSRFTGDSSITMGAVFVVVLTMGVLGYALVRALSAMDARHRQLTGRVRTVRRHTPWLRAMSGERPHDPAGQDAGLAALDYILVSLVVVAVLAFEVWLMFFAGSSLPTGT